MLIKNPDALKCWLIIILEPICDADSSALARYVLALLKKDKSEEELKNIMIEQLDVFLGEETNPFVDKLFNTIRTDEYLSTPITPIKSDLTTTTIDSPITMIDDLNVIKTESDQEPNSIVAKLAETPTSSAYITNSVHSIDQTKTKDSQLITRSSAEHTDKTQNNIDRPEVSSSTVNMLANSLHTANNHIRSASPPAVRTNIADKENQPRESRRRRASLRSRSRSRSNDRSARRSRSRDHRTSEREKNLRQFRNKSPMTNDTRYDRRHFGIGNDRRRMPGNMSTTSGNNSNDLRRARINSRSRSPSTDRNRNKSNHNTPERHQIERDNENRQRQRCREYDDKGYCARADVCPWDHSPLPTSHKGHINPIKSRSPSPSLERSKVKSLPLIITDRQLLHKLEKRQRCRDFDEKGYCVRGETCPWDHGINPVVFEGLNNSALISMSLREYNPDAPEIWARGTPANNLANRNPNVTPSINPFTGVARPSAALMNAGPSAGFTSDKNRPADYTRAGINGPGFHAATPGIPFPFNPAAITTPLQRELIPIPVVDANTGDVSSVPQQSKRRFELEDSVAIAEGPSKRKVPLNSRLGPRVASMQNNCALELRKVPRGLNTIAHLNNHFAKFGKIVNIQISYDGDPEAAIITFSTHAEANVAYRSTEAVLNNRFIKVFWHTQDSNTTNNNVVNETNANTNQNRKNSQYHLNNIPAVPTPTADSAKTTNTAAVVSSQTPTTTALTTQANNTTTSNGSSDAAGANNTNNNNNTSTTTNTPTTTTLATTTHAGQQSLRLKNNVTPRQILPAATNAIIRKKQEEQAKAVVQLANGLRKRKQELLQSYLKQMKSALELVERAEPNDPQRTKTLETIKILQETIDKLRKEIANDQEQAQAQIQNQQPPPKKTKEQQKKELLDIELELFAQQQEGNDTSAIQKRLEDLQRSLGIIPGSTGTSGASSKSAHFANARNNTRGRASYPEGSTRVDRRPKTIVVTGFTKEEADFVLGHFKHFGEITKHDVDKDIPQLILSYATRVNAEQAVLRGKVFKDKRLQISWAPIVTTSLKTNAKIEQMDNISDVDNILASPLTPKLFDKPGKEVEPITPDILPELRLEDEEEDDESEDRTWRR